jgi:MFS transporter, SHS family, lactate transporter
MAGVLQASWRLGALLSSVAYALLYNAIGLAWPADPGGPAGLGGGLYIRNYVEEPEIWARNRETQRKQKREVHSVGQVPG